MREIDSKLITNSIYKCCVDAAYFINDDVLKVIEKAKDLETDSIAKPRRDGGVGGKDRPKDTSRG